MANKIKPRRSYTASSVPLTSDLDTHELAIRWTPSAPAMFTKDSSGNIVTVALGGGGSASVVTAATVSGFPGTGTAGVLYAALDTGRIYEWQGAYLEMGVTGGGPGSLSGSVTIPALGDPYADNNSLLLHMDLTGNSFVDSSGTPKTVTAYGDATQSTAQKKFGTKSAYFDGNGDYIQLSTYQQSGLQFGAQQHTVEFWFKTASTQQYTCLFYKGRPQSSAYDYVVNINNSSASSGDIYIFSLGFGGVAIGTSAGGWNDDAWHHLAIVRDAGNVWRIYVDGVQRVSATNAMTESYSTQSDSIIRIGKDGALSGRDFAGYIDELRITTVCRYPSGTTFTPATSAFPDATSITVPVTITVG